jgi:cytochrome c-type biogenesis protein CcmH/NrfG
VRALCLLRYGLGTAYLRKNKYRQAEHSFRRAVEINPENAVLICCVGQVRPVGGGAARAEQSLPSSEG